MAAGTESLHEAIKLLWMFALGLDLYRRNSGRLDRSVQLRVLQSDVDFHYHRAGGQHAVQAENMVRWQERLHGNCFRL